MSPVILFAQEAVVGPARSAVWEAAEEEAGLRLVVPGLEQKVLNLVLWVAGAKPHLDELAGCPTLCL